MKSQLGFTLIELISLILAAAAVSGVVFMVYVLVHFLSKFW